MYDGSDNCGEGGPVCFDPKVTHHMNLYDVGMTALFLSDTQALIDLANARGRSDLLPTLNTRLARVSAAMNAHMWNPTDGTYSNILYNGSFYPRYSPTSLFPMISGQASVGQVEALMVQAASPLGFCLNTTYTPDLNAEMITQWWDGSHDNAACVSEDCLKDVVNAAYSFIQVEAVVLTTAAPAAPGLVPLYSWYSTSRHDYALTNTSSQPPDEQGGYQLVRQEGWCYSSPPTPTAGYPWPTNQLSLWYSSQRHDYQTCGSPHCLSDVSKGYTFVGNLCYAFNGTGPLNMPCKFGGNSIVRGDAAFFDNNCEWMGNGNANPFFILLPPIFFPFSPLITHILLFLFAADWRGRIWGPHVQLIYWALSNPKYADIPSVVTVRKALVAQGKRLVLQEWDLFRQVTENVNGINGIGEDVGNADPFYHWGALPGFISFLENKAY